MSMNHLVRISVVRWPSKSLMAGCLLVSLLMAGCSQPKQVEPKPTALSQAEALQEDVTDPTAAALHELAGKILLYIASHKKLPSSLSELAISPVASDPANAPDDAIFAQARGAGVTSAQKERGVFVDPATGRPFVYTPDSARHPRLPGRVIVFQSTSQGSLGRWAMIINDLSSHGEMITYIQRVPDAWLPAVKESHPTVRLP